MKSKNKRGFTVVELVVIIAVLAVLAVVLIPTFSSIIKNANRSTDIQTVRNMNTALSINAAAHSTMFDAIETAKANGCSVDALKSTKTGDDHFIAWDSVNDRFVLIKTEGDTDTFVFPQPDGEQTGVVTNKHEYFRVYDSMPDTQTYSIYLDGSSAITAISVTVGFDAGENYNIPSVTYTNNNTPDHNVIIRTCSTGTNLTVTDTTNSRVSHFCDSGNQTINCGTLSYHEYGGALKATVQGGHYVAEAGSIVVLVDAAATEDDVVVELESGSIQGTVKNTNTSHSVEIIGKSGAKTVSFVADKTNNNLKATFATPPTYTNTTDVGTEDDDLYITGVGSETRYASSQAHDHNFITVPGSTIKICSICGEFEYTKITVTVNGDEVTTKENNYSANTNSDGSITTVNTSSDHTHSYSTEWTWHDECDVAELKLSCDADDCGYSVTIIIPTNSGSITNNGATADCVSEVTKTFTATVEYEGKPYTDTKEITLDPIGHDGDPCSRCGMTTVSVRLPNIDQYLYRVGNMNDVASALIFNGNVTKIVYETIAGDASCVFNQVTQQISFAGKGVLKISANEKTVLFLEVVDAVNATTATNATGNNVVLLNDIETSGTISVSNGYTIYGNGYKITFTGNGSKSGHGISDWNYGYLMLNNGNIENVQVICPHFNASYGMITADVGSQVNNQYPYMLSAVTANGNSLISDCYIYGARTNIFSANGDVTIKNTVCECGSTANIQLWSNDNYTVTLDNVTTIQYNINNIYGTGVICGTNETSSNAKIVIKNGFSQYNWVSSGDAGSISNTYIKRAINEAVNHPSYQHSYNNTTYINLGIIYLNNTDATVIDERDNSGYDMSDISFTILGNEVYGQVYSVINGSVVFKDSSYEYEPTNNGYYLPTMNFAFNAGSEYVSRENGVIKVQLENTHPSEEINFSSMFSSKKYETLTPVITCINTGTNAAQAVNDGRITFTTQGNYNVTYTVTDSKIYDKDGILTENSVQYTKTIPVIVTIVNSSLSSGKLSFNQSTQKFYYYPTNSGSFGSTEYIQYLPLLNGLKIEDYNGNNGVYTVFDGDDSDQISKIVRIDHQTGIAEGGAQKSITTFYFNNGGYLEMKYNSCANSGKGGGATISIKVGSDNKVYAVVDGPTKARDEAFYWPIDYYKYTGNNGKTVTVNGNTSLTTSTAELDLSTAANNASGRTTELPSRNQIMLFDNNGNPKNGVVFIGAGSLVLTKDKTSTDESGYYCFNFGYRANQGSLTDAGSNDVNVQAYLISLNSNADDVSTNRTYILTTGTASSTGNIMREGFTFDGWYTQAIGGVKAGTQTIAGNDWSLSSYVVNGDVTLYAHWLKDVTITFNTQGGDAIPAVTEKSSHSIVLPTPTRYSYSFTGWYDAAEGGNLIGDAGDTYYVPESDKTLYAHWNLVAINWTVNVNYNDGVTNNGTLSYKGEEIALPETPIYGGTGGAAAKTFAGWYTEASGGTKIGDGGVKYTPSEDGVTVYAQWDTKYYNVTFSVGGNAPSKSVNNLNNLLISNVPYGTIITRNGNTVTVGNIGSAVYSYSSGYEINEWKINDSSNNKFPYTVVGDTTIYAKTGKSCVTTGTLVTLADGTKKTIEDINVGDMVMTWSFWNGCYEAAPVAIKWYHGTEDYEVLTLNFSDGNSVRTINNHGFFDLDLNTYAYITPENVSDYIGHSFAKYDNGEVEIVQLQGYEITVENVGCYSLQTAFNDNFITEDILSITAEPFDGYFERFEYGDNMMYDKDSMESDIATYGLYSYEDWIDYLTPEQFYALSGQYFKVLIGRGVLTYEDIFDLISVNITDN